VPAAATSIQNDCTLLFVCNGLACLPVANCTTGAQRFLAALSNRLPLPLVDARHAAVEIRRIEQAIVLDDHPRNPMKLAVADIAATT
jgi:hypothetical protein